MPNQTSNFRLLKQQFLALFDHFLSFQGSPTEESKKVFFIQASPPKPVQQGTFCYQNQGSCMKPLGQLSVQIQVAFFEKQPTIATNHLEISGENFIRFGRDSRSGREKNSRLTAIFFVLDDYIFRFDQNLFNFVNNQFLELSSANK